LGHPRSGVFCMKKQILETVSSVDSIDNITNMADLDLETIQEFKQSLQEGKEVYFFSRWLDFNNDETTIDNIKLTFRVIHEYLKDSAKQGREKFSDDKTQKGIRAIMVLVDEAAKKIDRWTSLFAHKTVERSVKEFKEYQDLREFYHKKLLKKIRSKEEEKDVWLDSLEEEISALTSAEEKGLKDLKTVKEDKEYELFLIKKEDGKPFFNRNLLRHIKLVHDFDVILFEEFNDDPFIQMQKIREKTAFESARELRARIDAELKTFVKAYPYLKNSEFYTRLTQAFYALVLATSFNNLSEKQAKKGSDQYFADFCYHLCDGFVSSDYRALSDFHFDQMNQLMKDLMFFGYKLCLELFHHVMPKGPMMGLLNSLMGRVGKGETHKFKENRQMWTGFLESNVHLHNVLNKYPNGPLFKLLDHFDLAENSSYEPLMQKHYPNLLYSIQMGNWRLEVLKVPSPTRQEIINKAEGSLLFLSYMKALPLLKNNPKVFFINLQDRTSWQDAARCQYLESINAQAEFRQRLEVATVAKNTSFYNQSEEYLGLQEAPDFKKLLKEQVHSGQECGFYFKEDIDPKYLAPFVDSCVELIHDHFFGGKQILSRKNRLDFIELFYNFLMLKLIDIKKPSFCIFSCKDGVDTSATTSAGFYGFVKIFSEDNCWSPEEADFFLWMMHSSALLERERAVRQERFERVVQALMVAQAELELNRVKIIKDFEKLYESSIFKSIVVSESKS
jgi:hypothetical protein